jgi:hypothetical protein
MFKLSVVADSLLQSLILILSLHYFLPSRLMRRKRRFSELVLITHPEDVKNWKCRCVLLLFSCLCNLSCFLIDMKRPQFVLCFWKQFTELVHICHWTIPQTISIYWILKHYTSTVNIKIIKKQYFLSFYVSNYSMTKSSFYSRKKITSLLGRNASEI